MNRIIVRFRKLNNGAPNSFTLSKNRGFRYAKPVARRQLREYTHGKVQRRGVIIFVQFVLAMILSSLFIVPVASQNARGNRPARPAPRWPDGRINLNSPPGETGLWGGSGRLAINPRSYEPNTTLRAPIHINDVPLQPWARALVDYRHSNFLKDEPYTRCKPSPLFRT